MKKNYKTYAFAVLLIIAILAIMDGVNNSNAAEELRKEKDRLAEKAASFEKEYENNAKMLDEARKETAELEKEIESLSSAIEYKEFSAAIKTIESYKALQSFEEANAFMARIDGSGYYTGERSGKCHCGFIFNGEGFEWIPNSVLDLKEFRIEKDKISLTYQTVEEVKQDYQFVMVKAPGQYDREEKWRVEEITLVEKVPH
ncbi:hypothetical protein [Bacillus sp. NTK034]|uniref:hypothetical protein n=1 Tax=Bacillus sp. NTK034 TaxID=2802176 RepID=UPI001A8EC391|nr:hypothetical protein [Bacillus sp. NTK034]MBN8204206.1 hypothetical protein [Bacillus sp. NTK034]